MVKTVAKATAIAPAAISVSSSMSGAILSPLAVLHVSTIIWKKDAPIHRIHLDAYKGDEFNPGMKGDARFSPIKNATGSCIPTMYGGNTFSCAAMESVFHDVPLAPGFKSYDKRKLDGQVYSVLMPTSDLVLADLSSVALRKLGITRKQLIDTEKNRYPDTRLWAEAIHTQCLDIQGLFWVSRQDDQARAMILFGDRIDAALLVQQGVSRSLPGDTEIYDDLLDIAYKIGVNVVAGKSGL